MKYRYTYFLLILFLLTGIFTSCTKQWDKHDIITDAQLTKTLLDQINQNTTLSTFSSYLQKTGYDKLIASSKTFTVWAPNNAALQSLDQSIVADTVKLKQFVGNFISNQSYLTSAAQPSIRIKTLNGKNITFTQTTFEEANIIQANQYVANGILHIIDKAVTPKMNIWEFVNSTTTVGLKQKAYLQTLSYTYVDTTQATQTGVDPTTGKPILKPGTGVINANTYLNTVADVSNEDKQYTFIVLTDAAYDTERNKVSKFFTTTGNYGTKGLDSTTYLSAFNVLKDVTINGLITPAQLTDTLLSVNNVKVPINKSAILQTYYASNGIVYVMSSVPFRITDKIPTVYIQGENPASFARTDKNNNIQYRSRRDQSGNITNDILIAGSGAGSLTAQFYAQYLIQNLYSAQYKVYWRASNDTGTVFSQQLSFGTSTAATFVYTPVPVANTGTYSEVSLGNYTQSKYGNINMFMTGANNTTTGTNSITFDYVKLVPITQ
ncbi:MAG: fasciclin domain-containing protein [Janthinobacterium lividum]